ncbi:hypothetical protein ACQP2Y_36010 [Actinoplanes sp. CA-051413]|uniref:hypothetical protein n=1 Tax=Actinoplanes sp. CA-051413 TaxID=3239899 RepID=UPI003D99D414
MAADLGNAGSLESRLDRHRAVAAALTGLDDDELATRVDTATPLGVGIGGRTARLDVAGVPVFVKRIPLTDLERRPGHLGSTANLFGLPTCYQYGVGSTGFGAWRELATHHTTTQWVRSGVSARFPLLHHWRVLPSPPAAPPDFGDWDGDQAVARRLAAIEAATGLRLYLSDFGLALDGTFALSNAETAFLDLHRDWDRWDTRRYLVNWLCHRLAPETGRRALIRDGGPGLPAWARAVVRRYGPTVTLLNDFYDRLLDGPATARYPAAELLTAGREPTPAVSPPRR